MEEPHVVLVGAGGPGFPDRVRALSDRIRVITPDELRADPALLQSVVVAFGGLPRERLLEAPRLRWFQTTGAGVNGLLGPEVRDRNLQITNASGIHAEPITEHMFGMLLMVTRRLAGAWDHHRARLWRPAELGAGVQLLSGRTLGLLGVGAIGGCSARVGRAFGMRVVGLRRTGRPHPDLERVYTTEERLEFFSECDVVMNTLPLTPRTRRLMGWEEFRALRSGCIVINTGRGATIHTPALVAALRDGRVGAALLDVTDPEPLPADHPLWGMENVFITPHYSGSHPGYQERAGRIFLGNLKRWLAGEPLVNLVDQDEGY